MTLNSAPAQTTTETIQGSGDGKTAMVATPPQRPRAADAALPAVTKGGTPTQTG